MFLAEHANIAAVLCLMGLLASPIAQGQQSEASKRPKIGVAFEGGGALGLGHVGVLEWLEKNHVPVDYIAGTSMGGLVGGLYATGNSPSEIRGLIRDIDWDEVLGGRVPFKELAFRRKEDKRAYPNNIELGVRNKSISLPSGLNSGQRVNFILDRAALPYSNLKSFDDLPIPFRCVATDLETGAARVFQDGSLSEALRATMSLPAVFTPVVTSNGKVYVDGGLINNLPVDVVKSMGADIVIAVYLETSPFDAKTKQSLLSISGRAVGLMIEANVKHNMEVADILVTVNLAGYTSSDYNRGDKIADQGYEGAEKKSSLLTRFAVDRSTWEQYLEQRASRKIQSVPTPQFVEVAGTDPHNAGLVQKALDSNVGYPVDTKKLEVDLSRVVGMGRFSSLNYQMVQRNGRDGLLIEGEEKTYAPPLLQPGVFIDGSQHDDILFSAGARLTFMDLGGFRSEWQTDITLGATWAVDSEYHRFLSPKSRLFYEPRLFAINSPLDLYSGGKRLAQYGVSQAGGGLDIGYELHRNSELRAGYTMGYYKESLRVGHPELPEASAQLSATSIKYTLDVLDNPVIPRTGEYLTSLFQYIDHAPTVGRGFYSGEIRGEIFHRISQPGSLFVSADGGTTFGRQDAIPQFFLGGGVRLGAYGRDEIRTNQYFLFRTGYVHELGTLSPLFGEKIYGLVFYELGKTYGGVDPSRFPTDVNVGMALSTLFGPVFVGGAYGDTGHHKIYFQIGRIF